MGLSPILYVIHTVTTMLNSGNNGHGLKNVTCSQTLIHSGKYALTKCSIKTQSTTKRFPLEKVIRRNNFFTYSEVRKAVQKLLIGLSATPKHGINRTLESNIVDTSGHCANGLFILRLGVSIAATICNFIIVPIIVNLLGW